MFSSMCYKAYYIIIKFLIYLIKSISRLVVISVVFNPKIYKWNALSVKWAVV